MMFLFKIKWMLRMKILILKYYTCEIPVQARPCLSVDVAGDHEHFPLTQLQLGVAVLLHGFCELSTQVKHSYSRKLNNALKKQTSKNFISSSNKKN